MCICVCQKPIVAVVERMYNLPIIKMSLGMLTGNSKALSLWFTAKSLLPLLLNEERIKSESSVLIFYDSERIRFIVLKAEKCQ